uniref:Uncharacterized protein n=1 Tax=Anguilla anguilla TaxID=7936 RepID=A0A0E9V9J6_ANGAN
MFVNRIYNFVKYDFSKCKWL